MANRPIIRIRRPVPEELNKQAYAALLETVETVLGRSELKPRTNQSLMGEKHVASQTAV